MYTKSLTAAIAVSLFASANAHFMISTPSPIPGSAPKDPLDPSGSNFPCHGVDLSAGTSTSMAVGSDQPIKFDLGYGANTAVHGGGSCQISITYEKDAAKLKDPASWKVIQSYVGGCPTNAMGNLPQAIECPGGNGQCVNQFSFKIPAEVQNGDAVLAWTWFNNVGNREMYMNCAKVTLSGGSNKLDALPNMLVANLASVNTCKTSESFNVDFPNPGSYVTKDSKLNYPLKAPEGNCGSGSGSANIPASGGSESSGSTGSGSTGSTGSTATTSANNGQYTGAGAGYGSAPAGNPGGIFAPGAASSPAVAAPIPTTLATSVVAVPTKPATSVVAAPTGGSSPYAAPASTPATAPASSGSCSNGQVSCPTDGFYCIDATTFGMCAWGCATPMKMSGGTDCSNGAVVHTISQSKQRRSSRHAHRRHLAASS